MEPKQLYFASENLFPSAPILLLLRLQPKFKKHLLLPLMAGANRTPKIHPVKQSLPPHSSVAIIAYISSAIINRPARGTHLFHTAHHAFGHLGDLVVHYCAYYYAAKKYFNFLIQEYHTTRLINLLCQHRHRMQSFLSP